MTPTDYDAILIVSFGGPEGREDVIPFLENVLRGRNVPRERMLEVAEHYMHFGGVSPINEQCRQLIRALRAEFDRHDIDLPIFWGNRNWHPMLADTFAEMSRSGVRRALAFVTSAYSSYSSCRQYRENLAAAADAVDDAPVVDKIRVFFNHPDFVEANVDNLKAAIQRLPESSRSNAHVVFTAHSIPSSMAATCQYVEQLSEVSHLVAEAVGIEPDQWRLVYQSRSGPPQVPWLEPDVCDHLRSLREAGAEDAVVLPIGFLSDHMEVVYDLDFEAQRESEQCGLNLVRAATVGTHPRFVTMIRKLIEERLSGGSRDCVGAMSVSPDVCAIGCCPAPRR